MKCPLRISLVLSLSLLSILYLDCNAQGGSQAGNNGISMLIYPVVRGADGNQYLITPSGKQVTIPGLQLAPNATQVTVYRDNANHFWYTNMNGQQVAATPQQLEIAAAQINAQSQGAMPPPIMPPAQSHYATNPTYASGYNGIPYGTSINMDGPGKYSYMDQSGNRQYIAPNSQNSAQFNQWQQQVPYGQQQACQGNTSKSSSSTSRMEMRHDRRANRLQSRSQNQAREADADQQYANEKIDNGQTLGTGFRGRKAARENRRSNREERRAERWDGQ